MNHLHICSRVVALGAALALAVPTGGVAFARQIPPADTTPPVERVPFGAGERAEYQVKLGALSVGSGSMEITGFEEVHGRRTFHARLRLSGGIPLARVDDSFESWIDVDGLFSRRFKQDQKEIRYRRNRTYEFYPESRSYRRLDTGEIGRLPTERPLDDVSFLYFVRTLPLEVGDEYEIPRYFKEDGNPVVIKVLRKETIRVPAGTFETVVVRPIIKTDGLFSEGGRAEVYFSDDDRRVLVMMRSHVPVIGSISLHLRDYEGGAPFSRASGAPTRER